MHIQQGLFRDSLYRTVSANSLLVFQLDNWRLSLSFTFLQSRDQRASLTGKTTEVAWRQGNLRCIYCTFRPHLYQISGQDLAETLNASAWLKIGQCNATAWEFECSKTYPHRSAHIKRKLPETCCHVPHCWLTCCIKSGYHRLGHLKLGRRLESSNGPLIS